MTFEAQREKEYKKELERIKKEYLEDCKLIDERYYPRHMKKWWHYTKRAATKWQAKIRALRIKYATK